MEKRPSIPEEVKREVRRRCGFGCVMCGNPLYEYEHMLEWAEVKRHVASEITLLCRLHHGQKTGGLLPKFVVEDANKSPHNLRAGVSTPLKLYYSGREVNLVIGGNSLNIKDLREGESFYPLMIDRVPIVAFTYREGQLYLSLNLFDEFNLLVLSVLENEIVFDAGQWDVEWVGRSMTIRQGPKRIFLKVSFHPPGAVLIEKGNILFNGVEVIVGKDYFFNSNMGILLQRCSVTNSNVGIVLGVPPEIGVSGMSFTGIDRYRLDRKSARQNLRKMLSESKAKMPAQ